MLGWLWKRIQRDTSVADRSRTPSARAPRHQKVVFIHLQKTAGTTAVMHLRGFFAPERFMSHGDFLAIPKDKLQDYDFISGHFGVDYVERILEDSYSFTFLREPVGRVVSQYTFLNQSPATERNERFPLFRIGRELTLGEFVSSTEDEVRTVVENMQAWQLAHSYDMGTRNRFRSVSDEELFTRAKTNLDRLTYVGFKETFNQDFAAILEDLGLPGPTRWEGQNRTAKPLSVEALDPATRAAIESRVAVDSRLYEYARKAYGK
jgi:hypothetical protein